MFIIRARILITIFSVGIGHSLVILNTRKYKEVLSVLNLSEMSFYNEVKIKVKIFIILNYPFLSC